MTDLERYSTRRPAVGCALWVSLTLGVFMLAFATAFLLGRATGGNVTIPSFTMLGLPVLVYGVVLRYKGERWTETAARLGIVRGSSGYYILALALGIVVVVFNRSVSALVLSESEIVGLYSSAYEGMEPGIVTAVLVLASEALNVALGEELLFRGLLAGWAMRRFGFYAGNAIQSVAFLLPHLLVLTVGLNLWPLMLGVLASGWIFGWLRYRSGSIWPGWTMHALGNAFAKMPL